MAKISPKENYLKLVNGGHPEYVPYFTMMGEPYLGEAATKMIMCNIFPSDGFIDGGKDMWGVPSRADRTMGIAMPDTSITILEDILDWRDTIVFPEPIPNLDLHRQYEEGLRMFQIDREQSAVMLGPGFSPFQELMGLMGFTGGLVAIMEEPEEVSAMLNAMIDHIEPYFDQMLDVYKPDIWYLADDSAARETPFFSPQVYHDLFLPLYRRLTKPAVDRGIPVQFHNCGRCEDFLDDMLDFGVTLWDPAQETNKLLDIKEKYKGRLSIIGGWDWDIHMPKNYPQYDEQELRESIRHCIDTYAPGGAFGLICWPISYKGDPVIKEVNRIVRDECHWYAREIYGYTADGPRP